MSTVPTQEELQAWLRLSLEPGLEPAAARHLLAVAGLPQGIYAQPAATLRQWLPAGLAAQLRQPPAPELQAGIDAASAWLAEPGHHLLTLADSAYPPSLLDLHDPPLVLYVHGDPASLRRSALAIVGARSATPAGQDNARAFARHLAAQGWCIVSGLAQGIDAAAHEGALQAGPDGAGTVAVLGTGIDRVYPASQHALAREIAGGNGALVSEFPLGTRALPQHFPRRNRLVAALARGTLVVEAARQSGSLITARLAGELGREVFAIPGSIHSPLSRGCHALIRQGAKLVESAQDIEEELRGGRSEARGGRRTTPRAHAGASDAGTAETEAAKTGVGGTGAAEAEAEADTAPLAGTGQAGARPPAPGTPPGSTGDPALDAVLAALGHDPVDTGTLAARTSLPFGELAGLLTRLQLQDRLDRLPDGRYQQRPQDR